MNKKFISSLVTLAIVMNVSVCFSAEKKDVTDPVLREMINSLSTKMPKFINQYGASVFVADEKVTRGALIKALYEYDKKTSGLGASALSSSDGDLTKKQYTALSNRIAALEKNSASTTGGKTKKSASGSVDIVAVMNDLEPNMPMLLDSTLMQSKVFRDLQRKVNLASNGGNIASEDTPLGKNDSKTILALRKQVALLNKKMDNFETSSAAGLTNKEYNLLDTRIAALEKNSASITGKEDNSLGKNDSKTILALRKQVALLNKKMDNFETSSAAGLTNKEYNLLDTRIAAIEKNSVSATGKEDNSSTDTKTMLTLRKQIVMLNKKIDSFEAELSSASNDKKSKSKKTSSDSDEIAEMKSTLNQIQKSYVAMSKRVNELENTQSALVASDNSSGKSGKLSNAQMKNINLQIASIKKTVENIPTNDYVDAEIQKVNTQTAKDIKRIENRLNNLKNSGNFNDGSSKAKSDSSDGSSKTGTIAKISLGLTMIAALFIAR